MKCFYHSADLDGHCSGAIVKFKYPKCEMFGINYGDEFPWELIKVGEIVFMVDFALQPFNPNMTRLMSACELVWIDHHISAIKDWQKCETDREKLWLQGARSFDSSKAGCKLTWDYLFDDKAPYFIDLLSEYDVWNHSDPNTLPFQFGMRLYHTLPDEDGMDFWLDWLDADAFDKTDVIIEQGKLILRYNKQENEKYVQACGFEITLDGLKCIAINKMLTNSQIFDSVWDAEKFDAMLTFGFKGKGWTVSLYSDKEDVDVSVIAKNRGGGGHKGAAGFQCKTLPF